MGMHVVIVGNVVDGIRIFGPFKTGELAIEWAQAVRDYDWWVAPLEAKDDL